MIYTISLNPAIDRTVQVDQLKLHEINTAEVKGHVPAGKGINVCRTLSSLNVDSSVVGLIGKHEKSWFQAALKKQNIGSEFISVEGLTRVSITIMDKTENNETHIKEKGFNVKDGVLEKLNALITKTITTNDTVCLTGSAPPGVSEDQLKGIALLLQRRSGFSVCDLGGNLLNTVKDVSPSLIKPNRDELEELTGKEKTADMLDTAINMGFEQILLTLGAEGAVFHSETEHFSCPAPPIKLASTVGAGDASLAGFLAARFRGSSIEECLKWAVAAGSANAEEPFAGVIRKARFEEMLASLVVKRET